MSCVAALSLNIYIFYLLFPFQIFCCFQRYLLFTWLDLQIRSYGQKRNSKHRLFLTGGIAEDARALFKEGEDTERSHFRRGGDESFKQPRFYH